MKILIGLYLTSIVVANLTVASFGAAAVIPNSLVLIALDLTARDRLHDLWHGRMRNMALLIATGSILSAALSYAAIPVALASFLAFGLSESVDTLVYARMEGRSWYIKVNGSNAASALVDSVVFLSLLAAFGGVPWSMLPLLIAGQWCAKVLGGAGWAWVFRRRGAE